jgi:glycosyl transferase family 25
MAKIMPRLSGDATVHVIDAVDGRALNAGELTSLAGDLYAPRIRRRLRPNEIGCSASHLKALRAFLDTGARHAIILEDDAEIQPGGLQILSEILELKPDCDVLKIGGTGAATHPGVPQCTVRGVSVLQTVDLTFGSFAYAVSRAGAEKLLRHGLPITCTFDDYLRQIQWHGCRLFETAPHLTGHDDGGVSTIGNVGEAGDFGLRQSARTAWYRTVSGGRKAWIRLRRFGPFHGSLVRLPTTPTAGPTAPPGPAGAEPPT